jgi:hypothetical protein
MLEKSDLKQAGPVLGVKRKTGPNRRITSFLVAGFAPWIFAITKYKNINFQERSIIIVLNNVSIFLSIHVCAAGWTKMRMRIGPQVVICKFKRLSFACLKRQWPQIYIYASGEIYHGKNVGDFGVLTQ